MSNNNSDAGFYGRTAGLPDTKRTYIQGMGRPKEPSAIDGSAGQSTDRAIRINLQDRHLAGVLFSVSSDAMGELFPIYIGRNTIGSEPECDVYLPEETVSGNHAVLLVRMLPDGQGGRRMSASITDYDSEFGSSVNGEALGYDKMTLDGNEIIAIGNSYQFLFVPLEAAKIGLYPKEGFSPLPRQRTASYSEAHDRSAVTSPVNSFYQPAKIEEIYPNVVGEEDEQTFYGRTYAKKEDHSSKKTIL